MGDLLGIQVPWARLGKLKTSPEKRQGPNSAKEKARMQLPGIQLDRRLSSSFQVSSAP